MGTRADFYVGRGLEAEWIGSITWDGYPDGIDGNVFACDSEDSYRRAVDAFFVSRRDVTRPTEPWPWPWETSSTTEYAYAFEGDTVYASSFGHAWFKVDAGAENFGEPDDEGDTRGKVAVFPDMTGRKGSLDHIMRKSGLIQVSLPGNPA
jgi:hypothetical protein